MREERVREKKRDKRENNSDEKYTKEEIFSPSALLLFFSLPQESGHSISDVSRHQLYLLLIFLTTKNALTLSHSHSHSYYITHNAKRSLSHDYYHAQGVVVPILSRGEDDDDEDEWLFFFQDDDEA